MNIVLWVLQVLLAVFCIMGSVWRISNYEQAAKDIASLNALSYPMWVAIGVFEIVCGLGLILPGAFSMKPILTPIFAACLAVELLLISGLHVKYFGFAMRATNPAMWSIGLAVLAALVAYGRIGLRPFEGMG